MALFMWMDGVPGRPGWDGWFEISAYQFEGDGQSVRVSKRTDASTPAIRQRFVRGDTGTASLWGSGENDRPLYQIDMTAAMVTSIYSTGEDESFALSFAKYTWRNATDS